MNGVWLGRGSKNKHQKDMWFKEIGLRAQNMLTILSEIVNIILGGGHVCPLYEHENLHFDNAYNNQMNLQNYKANDYMWCLDLLIISH